MRKYQTILFDLDGTTLNTLPDLRSSLNAALVSCGFPARTMDDVRRFVGNGVGKLVRRALPPEADEEDWRQVLARQKAYYSSHLADETVPYEGIPEMLKELKTNGYRIAVVSNKYDSAVQKLCGLFFSGLLDAAVGEKEDVPRKPDPTMVRTMLDFLDGDPFSTIYVGDSETDLETARNAGCLPIMVDWGFRSREALIDAGADRLVSDPHELLLMIRELN